MKKPYRDFDLPTKHLITSRHYVPPKARSPHEIERRHLLPTGTLLAEHQHRGMIIANSMLKKAEDGPDLDFVTRIVGSASINSAWYGFARGSSVMRRRLNLPTLAVDNDHPRPSVDELLETAIDSFDELEAAASGLTRAVEMQLRDVCMRRKYVGKLLGNAGLMLSAVKLGNCIEHDTAFVAQARAREQSLIILDQARNMHNEIGVPPSIAQLADPNSDLAVYIRRHAPNIAYEAFESASAMYSIPT